jgi:hypothetical protein
MKTELRVSRAGLKVDLLFFLFGPLLLLVGLICADARGGSALEAAGQSSQGGLRYVLLAGFLVTFVGVMVSLANNTRAEPGTFLQSL